MANDEKTVYEWREHSRLAGDPQRVGEALADLDEKHGGLTPSVVVQKATSKRSPLHGYFEWNDGIAAQRYREDQARLLIRSVRVVSEDAESSKRPAYVHVGYGNESNYQRPELVVQDEDRWAAVIRETLTDLRGTERRLEELIRMESKARRSGADKIRRTVSKAAGQAELALNKPTVN